jgi:hypothetical protein
MYMYIVFTLVMEMGNQSADHSSEFFLAPGVFFFASGCAWFNEFCLTRRHEAQDPISPSEG